VHLVIRVLIVVLAWWVGASGLLTMADIDNVINNARDKIEGSEP
jgi:hypothetical protein